MPKLYRSRSGSYYTKYRSKAGQVITLQIDPEGQDWLDASGIDVGDELGVLFWELSDNDWLYTKGEVSGGGDLEDGPSPWIQNEVLRASPAPIEPPIGEAITIPCDDEFTEVPRFLFAPHRSIYYTIMHIENSSDHWLEVPVLIKHRGAMELLNLGATLGEEFTETGLRLLFERRWAYLDEEWIP